MISAAFEYSSSKTLSETIALLREPGADAKILAGGMSLIPLMKLRVAARTHESSHLPWQPPRRPWPFDQKLTQQMTTLGAASYSPDS